MKTQEEVIAFARESLGLSQEIDAELSAFEGRGSDRCYYRFRWGSRTAILMQYQTSRIENAYYAEIGSFLLENHIPVPRIIRHDAVACLMIMDDLEDTDLWCLRNESWDRRKSLYQHTLQIVHRLHSYPEAAFPHNRVRLTEAFGPDLYRWEREYFRENFVAGLCAIHLEETLASELEKELACLAERLSAARHTLVHRDLQSQNVMIYRNEPYLIDFQGMRFGTRFYDLGSILCDPYVQMSDTERKDLLRFYFSLSESEMAWDDFQKAFWEASAQRLMQALGAYGFLGMKKGLKSYLAHVPAAIRNLHTAAENASALPGLLEVCVRCEDTLAAANFENRDSKSIGG